MQKSSELQWLDETLPALQPVGVLRYVAVFGVADVLLGIVLGFVISLAGIGNNPGFNVGVLIASCMAASLLFTRKHKRLFLRREYWTMLLGSVAIDLMLQFGITFAIVGVQLNLFFIGLMLFTAAMHALLMAFFYSRHIVKHLLPKPQAG